MALGSVLLMALLQVGAQAPRYETLENGLRVVVVEDQTLPLVSVQLWYSVGSACDPPERPGMCRVARAVLGRRDDADLRLGGAGLALGGETYQDVCSFTTVLPPNFLEYVLNVEARRIRPVGVTADELSRALASAALLSEKLTAGVENTAVRYVLREMFPGGPYVFPADLLRASMADVSTTVVDEFLQTWFVPRNATLFVIGDVSPPVVMDLVRMKFGEIPGGAAPQSPPRQSPPAGETTFVAADLEERIVTVAFLTPSLGMYENAAIDVLMQRLFDEGGDMYRAALSDMTGSLTGSAWYRTRRWRDAGLLLVFASFNDSRDSPAWDRAASDWRKIAERVRDAIVRDLSRAAADIPSPVEHNRLRNQAVLADRPRWMRFESRAALLAEYEMIAGDMRLADFAVPRLRSVAVPDVQAAATMLLESPCVVVHPMEGGEATVDIATKSTSHSGAETATLSKRIERVPPYFDAADVLIERLAQLTEAAPQAITPSRRPQITETEISPYVCLRVCRFPDPHWTSVATQLTSQPVSETLTWYSSSHRLDEAPVDDVRRFESYGAYHGLYTVAGMNREADRSPAGWWTSGDPAAFPALLEWHAKLLRSRFDSDAVRVPHVTVAAVGSVDANQVAELTKENWSAWRPGVRAFQRLFGGARSDPDSGDRRTPGKAVEISWTECEAGQEWVKFSGGFDMTLKSLPSEVEARALLLLCGAAPDSLTAVAGGSADFYMRFSDGLVSAARPPCDPDYKATVLGAARRLKKVRDGRVERSALEAATRITRVRKLLDLDSTTAVMSSLLRGETDPWLLGDPPEMEELRRRVVDAARALQLDVRISISDGPSAEVRDDLQRQANEILESGAP